jgi:murein DD-endopeptidase MepM/ murein hydrolase activator NlpD
VPVERSVETRSAEIRRSLIEALDEAEIPDNVVTRMADIFGTDVDLQRDLRRGDRLRVVYETLREAGSLEPPIVGRILAVQFRGGSRKLEAVWFDRADGSGGYHAFDGRNLARPFLASPLEFTRVSSGFSANRLHPVMRDWRAHKGVDLPAPIGTHVRAVANGTIDFIGQQRGYGNVIVVKHDARHMTLYAHLHRFSEGLEPGATVQQGEVIGTVGQTGWATGPHLHFEFHIDGQHVDPMAVVAQEPVRALQSDERARFNALAGQYRARFGLLDTQLAARFE